jgi:hypothetical protein
LWSASSPSSRPRKTRTLRRRHTRDRSYGAPKHASAYVWCGVGALMLWCLDRPIVPTHAATISGEARVFSHWVQFSYLPCNLHS